MPDTEEVQSSAYVSSQILRSTSIPSTPLKSEEEEDLREEKNENEHDEKDYEGHYEGRMDRFFQSEVRPIYFGGKNDAYLLLKVTIVAALLVNLFGVLVYMQYDHFIPQNPSEHHPHGINRLFMALRSALSDYYSDGQVVVGWMLSCWFLGYNVISAVIWWQFERREHRVPDDYEIIPTFRMRRRGNSASRMTEINNPNPHNNPHNINDPTVSHDSFKRFSKSQIFNNEPQNPFDKSVIVISMPNGDFSVGKRQKTFFNQ